MCERGALSAALREHDAGGEIIDANPAAQRILGFPLIRYTAARQCDPRWKALYEDGTDVPGETHPSAVIKQTARQVHDVVMAIFNPDSGGDVWLLINAVPQFHPGNPTTYQACCTFDDIIVRTEPGTP